MIFAVFFVKGIIMLTNVQKSPILMPEKIAFEIWDVVLFASKQDIFLEIVLKRQ